jgi:hypothetical protein
MKNGMGQLLSLDDFRKKRARQRRNNIMIGAGLCLAFYTAVGVAVYNSRKNAPPITTPQIDHFVPTLYDFIR